MQAENIAVNNPHIALPFSEDNIAASQAYTAMNVVPGSGWWPAPADGYVVGLSAALSDVLPAGTLTLQINISTPLSIDVHEAAAFTVGEFGVAEQFPVGMYPFSAGDRLGVNYESNALGVATLDLTAVLLVVLTGVRV